MEGSNLCHDRDDGRDPGSPESLSLSLLGKEDAAYPKQRRHLSPWYIHGVFLCFNSVLLITLVFLGHRNDNCSRCGVWSSSVPHTYRPLPDREGIIWEQRQFPTNIKNNPFAGVPRPSLDQAWHDLLQNDNIRVPKYYLEERNLTSIYTEDGAEGIASLSVYHSLHCLKKVKRMLHRDYYHKDKSEVAMEREVKHVDHCVEYLRETLMCQPDLSMVTFRWINNTAQHPQDVSGFYPTNFDIDMHTCANWNALDLWASERRFDLFRLDLLQRPEPRG